MKKTITVILLLIAFSCSGQIGNEPITAAEAKATFDFYNTPDDNDLFSIFSLIRQAAPERTFIDCNITLPLVTHFKLENKYGFTLTSTIPSPGFRNITKIEWATVNPGFKTGESDYKFVSGSNATTTSQTLQTITGLTAILFPTSTYEIEAVLSVGTSSVTTGTGYGIDFTGAGASFEGHITGAVTATTSKSPRLLSLNTASSGFLTVSNLTGGVTIKGILTTTAAGILAIKHLKTTSGTSTVFVNSYLKVTRIK